MSHQGQRRAVGAIEAKQRGQGIVGALEVAQQDPVLFPHEIGGPVGTDPFAVVGDGRLLGGRPGEFGRLEARLQGAGGLPEISEEPLAEAPDVSPQSAEGDDGVIVGRGGDGLLMGNAQTLGQKTPPLVPDVVIAVDPAQSQLPLPEGQETGLHGTLDLANHRIGAQGRGRDTYRRGAVEA